MKKFIFVLLGLSVGFLAIGGILTLLGIVFSLTFGFIGGVITGLFKILSTPVLLVLIIIILAYKLKKKSTS